MEKLHWKLYPVELFLRIFSPIENWDWYQAVAGQSALAWVLAAVPGVQGGLGDQEGRPPADPRAELATESANQAAQLVA
jgi:hypothetical protein